jgi:hypothetical protein
MGGFGYFLRIKSNSWQAEGLTEKQTKKRILLTGLLAARE